jgi:hypothetical protein
LRAERGLKVFENKLLRKVLGHKGKEASNKTLEKAARYGVLWFLFLTKHYFGDKIQQNAIDGTCVNYK